MKRAFLFLFALSVVSCQKSVEPTRSAFFVGDSGYVVKKKGLPFLLAAKLTDTVKSFWDQEKDTDTLGKFYKMDKGGAYLYCSIDLSAKYSFETHLLVKATPDGKVLRAERYFHGNYPSCLSNYYEGFQKKGGYFGLRACGTGSGYSTTKLYLFKDILPQRKQSPILENGFTLFPGIGEIALDSKMVYGKDKVFVKYTVTKGETDDDGKFVNPKIEKFDSRYTAIDGRWKTADSLKLMELGFEF